MDNVQEVLLYGSETWVMSPRIGSTLVRFHHRVARILMGNQPQKGMYGMWVYPPMSEVKAEARLHEVETYVSRHQNTVSQYISTSSIMDLCLSEYICPGTMFSKRWWER